MGKEEIVAYLEENGWTEKEIGLLNEIEETLPNHKDIFNDVGVRMQCGDSKTTVIEIMEGIKGKLDRLVKLVGVRNVLSDISLYDTGISETIKESVVPDLCSVIKWMAKEQGLCIGVDDGNIGDRWMLFCSKEEADKIEYTLVE